MGDDVRVLDRSARLQMTERGVPRRLEWNRHTFLVTDAPTRLEDALGALLTHPLPVVGWRFQGTAIDDGESRVFDVLLRDDVWWVVKTYR